MAARSYVVATIAKERGAQSRSQTPRGGAADGSSNKAVSRCRALKSRASRRRSHRPPRRRPRRMHTAWPTERSSLHGSSRPAAALTMSIISPAIRSTKLHRAGGWTAIRPHPHWQPNSHRRDGEHRIFYRRSPMARQDAGLLLLHAIRGSQRAPQKRLSRYADGLTPNMPWKRLLKVERSPKPASRAIERIVSEELASRTAARRIRTLSGN